MSVFSARSHRTRARTSRGPTEQRGEATARVQTFSREADTNNHDSQYWRMQKNADWQRSVGRIRAVHFVPNSIIFYKGWHPKLIAVFPHEGIICTPPFPGHVYSVPHVRSLSNMLKYCKLDQFKKEEENLQEGNLKTRREAEVPVQIWAREVYLCLSSVSGFELRDKLSSETYPVWQRCDDWHGDEEERKRGEKGCVAPMAPAVMKMWVLPMEQCDRNPRLGVHSGGNVREVMSRKPTGPRARPRLCVYGHTRTSSAFLCDWGFVGKWGKRPRGRIAWINQLFLIHADSSPAIP